MNCPHSQYGFCPACADRVVFALHAATEAGRMTYCKGAEPDAVHRAHVTAATAIGTALEALNLLAQE